MNMNRRGFLGLTAAAGAFGLSGCKGFPSITSRKSPNGVLRFGAIGCGSQGCSDISGLMGLMGTGPGGVWEESLGWGNGQDYTQTGGRLDIADPEFCAQQIYETREMVRASFNHPSVIIFAFLNECGSEKPVCKELVDKLVDAIKAEDSGRLVTFACNKVMNDICNEKTDLVAINAYPGTIPAQPGMPAELKASVAKCFNGAAARMRKLYPDKPIIVSESGCGAFYGRHDMLASFGSEEFQDEYLTDILETLWANSDYVGFSLWQFADTNTHHRNSGVAKSGRMLGISIAGIVDFQRRPKKSFETVRRFFRMQKSSL